MQSKILVELMKARLIEMKTIKNKIQVSIDFHF